MYFVKKYTTKLYMILLQQLLYYSSFYQFMVFSFINEDINKLENVNMIFNVVYIEVYEVKVVHYYCHSTWKYIIKSSVKCHHMS